MNHIEVTDEEKETIYSWLRDFNHEKNGVFMRSLEEEGTEIPIFLSSKDSSGKVIGGLEGTIIHRWLRVNIMAVDQEHRRKGIGSDLLIRAESIALQHGCQYSFVDTMSYQAPEFYTTMGYAQVGQIPNWDSHGHDKFYFTKELV